MDPLSCLSLVNEVNKDIIPFHFDIAEISLLPKGGLTSRSRAYSSYDYPWSYNSVYLYLFTVVTVFCLMEDIGKESRNPVLEVLVAGSFKEVKQKIQISKKVHQTYGL